MDSLLAAEDAAFAPGLRLEGCRKADSAHRHKSAEAEVLGCVEDGQVGRDSSLFGEDVVEGAAVGVVALDVAKFEKRGVIFQEAAEKDLAGNVAWHRSA